MRAKRSGTVFQRRSLLLGCPFRSLPSLWIRFIGRFLFSRGRSLYWRWWSFSLLLLEDLVWPKGSTDSCIWSTGLAASVASNSSLETSCLTSFEPRASQMSCGSSVQQDAEICVFLGIWGSLRSLMTRWCDVCANRKKFQLSNHFDSCDLACHHCLLSEPPAPKTQRASSAIAKGTKRFRDNSPISRWQRSQTQWSYPNLLLLTKYVVANIRS